MNYGQLYGLIPTDTYDKTLTAIRREELGLLLDEIVKLAKVSSRVAVDAIAEVCGEYLAVWTR